MKSMKYNAFGGAVIFEMTYATLDTSIKDAAIRQDVPFDEEWPDAVQSYYYSMLAAVPVTVSVEIQRVDGKVPEPLEVLDKIVSLISNDACDYVEVWEKFQLLPLDVINEWFEARQMASNLSAYLAPPGSTEKKSKK